MAEKDIHHSLSVESDSAFKHSLKKSEDQSEEHFSCGTPAMQLDSRGGGSIFEIESSSSTNGVVKDPKLLYLSPCDKEFAVLKQQMVSQLEEGEGEAIYEIGTGGISSSGLAPDELVASLSTLQRLATSCDADLMMLRQRPLGGGQTAELLVRRRVSEEDFLEVRVAVVGNVDAGKSTLLGVLTHGELDNGRGLARQRLFRHKHEMESGRTSSVGNDILGFDDGGKVVNSTDGHGGLNWVDICRAASKVITFIDLAGHEKYLKTTIFGMTGHAPDFCMLMIGANAGIIGMTKEHLGLALALSVPVFVVVTKVDMCPPNVLQENMRLLNRILKSPGCRKIPVLVQCYDDIITCATNFTSERICPIFQVSNVTGENIELLKSFLNLLSVRMHSNQDKPPEFQIDETYSVPGVGTVVSGTCLQGVVRMNDTLLLGPTSLGEFLPATIRGIHRKRMPVKEVHGGQTASFALKKIRRNQIRKGMVMVHPSSNPVCCWEFDGEILVLHHPTTISPKYQAMVHCGSTRQTASILSMSTENLRTGDRATCRFRFIKNPEYLHEGEKMVFREGRTKAIGNVIKIFPHLPGSVGPGGSVSSPLKSHKAALHRHHHVHSAAIGANQSAYGGTHTKTRGRRNRGRSKAAHHPSLATPPTADTEPLPQNMAPST